MLALLLGCTAPPDLEPTCDARVLEPGEVRARRLPCSDELVSDGEGRRSDYVIENAQVRFVIRQSPDALTRLGVAGGTIVDAVAVGGNDPLVEAVPQVGEDWLAAADLVLINEEDAAGIEVVGERTDGSTATVRYTLPADSPTLLLEGVDTLSVVPRPDTLLVGPALERASGDLLAADGAVTDLGGTVRYEGATALTVGSRQVVYEALWPDGQAVSGAATGGWVEVLSEEAVIARYPVIDGGYSGWLPGSADAVRAVQAGAEDGPTVIPGEESAVGAEGSVRLRVGDGLGSRPATLIWQDTAHPVLPGGVALTGPGEGTATIYAGPGFELAAVDLSIEGEVAVSVGLPWAVTPAVLADLSLLTAPDPAERRDDDDILDEAAAAGVEYAVLVARDEVSSANPGTSDHVFARTGTRSAGIGTPVAWSVSPSSNQPAHGAADWADLSPEDLLALLARRDGRTTIVGTEWIAAAGSPLGWVPMPDMVRIEGLDDVSVLADLYDAWIPLPPVGPLTWVEGLTDTFAAVDVEAMLQDGRTIATNGPRPVLTVDGEGPGAVLTPLRPVEVSLHIEAPSWIPLSGAALIGPGGEVLWEGSPEGVTLELINPPAWILGIGWGEEAAEPFLTEPAWAVTAPIWMDRP